MIARMKTAFRVAQPYLLWVIGLISCSMLMYEILLTRVGALRLFFHFSYLVVGNCLLAIGVSGTMISLVQDRWRPRSRFWIGLFSLLYVIALVATYAFLLNYPIAWSLDFSRSADILRFSVYNLVAALPFFFAGTVVGLVLTFNVRDVTTLYCVDLLGAALGCLIAPLLFWSFGAGGCLVVLTLLGLAATVAALTPRWRLSAGLAAAAVAAVAVAILPSIDRRFPVPGKYSLDLTDRVRAEILRSDLQYSRWSANSRIDLQRIAATNRFVYCRGTKPPAVELPEEMIIWQDGSAGTFILNFSEHPESLDHIRQSMYSASVRLRDGASVLVIGVGGGNDIWAAKTAGARRIKGIELNQQILDIHYEVLPHYSNGLTRDPRIELVVAEGRSALMREPERYDVIQMTGIDTWTALTSGAYMLAENYLYTPEAIESMYERLTEGGLLQITRMAADMESLRMLVNIQTALQKLGVGDLDRSVIALRTPDNLIATILKRGAFTEAEIGATEAFADQAGIEKIYLPGRPLAGAIPDYIRMDADAQKAFVRDYPRNITATSDNRPYFFNFSRWRNPIQARQYIAEPTAVSQGNPLFIIGQLAFSGIVAVVLIVVPLIAFGRRHLDLRYFTRFLVYFAGLGVGFIMIEIVLMQKLTLLLGHPIYSVVVTLFALLLFTGLGSMLSGRFVPAPSRRLLAVLAGLVVSLVAFVALAGSMVTLLIGLPLAVRILATVVVLAPVGLLLGVPFAYGLRLLDRVNPTLVPWAWAVNACTTVVGSVLAVILSMNFGFNAVLLASVAIYVIAFATVQTVTG